ncbi:hypothetical protein DVA67_025920 [Solirubrobacter sp. CPCC 204708]|uniref:Uncharacterized protein n=1 Tax=Solirubrobacter deserti TaxID=2282478 RepID=A0ABT4RFG3_9ACTN|nr:hypothetical protein [Solirubrobacter deserti]MBE2319439.1 hypothetical protein [Solirubrobacter deserti]MDA0137277.1 hypothetical protein [Solirubrobacter deserti]
MPTSRTPRSARSGLPSWAAIGYPLAVAVPIVLAFALGGPSLGLFVAAVLAVTLVTLAVGPWHVSVSSTFARGLAVVIVVALAGVTLVLTTDGVAQTIGWGVVGVAAVLALALAFFEVGLSEDRDRAASTDR